MKPTSLWVLSLTAAILLTSCAPKETRTAAPAAATDDDVKAMRAAGKLRADALQSGDIEKFLSVYQDDAVLLPPYSPEIIGKENARARLTAALKEIAIEPVADSREYEILGPNWLAERGRYSWQITPKEKGEAFQDSGNFMILWHKDASGAWKISWEMWSSSRPMVESKGN